MVNDAAKTIKNTGDSVAQAAAATDVSAARVIEAAIHALRTNLLPLLGDDTARMHCDHITRLLNNAAARLSKRTEGLRELVRDAGADAGIALSATEISALSLDALEQRRQAIEQAMVDRIPGWLDAESPLPAAVAALEKIIDCEKRFFISQDPDVAHGSQVVYRGGRIDADADADTAAAADAGPWVDIDAASLTAYLRRHFGRDAVSAEAVRTIPGGFSKQTIFFTLRDAGDGSTTDLVIRKDMPVPFVEKTVANEFGLLQHLHAANFPVAKPLWLESDMQAFGSRFIVSERIQGSSNVAQWAADPERARNACTELAKVLATLHAFQPTQLGYAEDVATLSAGVAMERDIRQWIDVFNARKTEPVPLQELPLAWLQRNIPRPLYERPARVIHGDAGFHNMMFDTEGRVAALLDWEFSVLGDPTQDLMFVKLFVAPLMDWREFLDLYLSMGGVAPCQEAEFFYDLWSKTRNTVGCVAARKLFDTVMPHEVKFALAGHIFSPYLYVDQCESLLAHLKKMRA